MTMLEVFPTFRYKVLTGIGYFNADVPHILVGTKYLHDCQTWYCDLLPMCHQWVLSNVSKAEFEAV